MIVKEKNKSIARGENAISPHARDVAVSLISQQENSAVLESNIPHRHVL